MTARKSGSSFTGGGHAELAEQPPLRCRSEAQFEDEELGELEHRPASRRLPSRRARALACLAFVVIGVVAGDLLLQHFAGVGSLDLAKSSKLLDVVQFQAGNLVRGHHLNLAWFLSELPPAHVVAQWNETELDQKLHVLSRWDGFYSHAQWRAFVMAQIRPLHLSASSTFRYLEVGLGVGAFAREILRAFPHATGLGFDLVPQAVQIASAVLPRDRMNATVGDMVDIRGPSHAFDLVLVPGALCYLSSMDSVRTAVAGFSRVLREKGCVCASMLSSETSRKGSCNVRIPKAFWKEDVRQKPFELQLVSIEEMDSWGLAHSLGRYAVCLQKVGNGGMASAAESSKILNHA